MKTRSKTTRHHHIRRVRSGYVPVRQHLMMYWKSMFPNKPLGYKPTPAAIKQSMLRLLYAPKKSAAKTHVISIIVPKAKEKDYRFLSAYTKYPARGVWKQYDEANSVFEVQYQDSPDETIGKSLITLVGLYNREVVGEKVPYAYTKPVGENTLTQDLDKDGVLDYADCEPLNPKKQDAAIAKGIGTELGESIGGGVPSQTPPVAVAIQPVKPTPDYVGTAKKVYSKLRAEQQALVKGAEESRAKAIERQEQRVRGKELELREKELKQQLRQVGRKPSAEGGVSAPRTRRTRAQRKLEALQAKLETERIKAELKELKKSKRGRKAEVPAPTSIGGMPWSQVRKKKHKSKKLKVFGVTI